MQGELPQLLQTDEEMIFFLKMSLAPHGIHVARTT
jgi:hypothetical protein